MRWNRFRARLEFGRAYITCQRWKTSHVCQNSGPDSIGDTKHCLKPSRNMRLRSADTRLSHPFHTCGIACSRAISGLFLLCIGYYGGWGSPACTVSVGGGAGSDLECRLRNECECLAKINHVGIECNLSTWMMTLEWGWNVIFAHSCIAILSSSSMSSSSSMPSSSLMPSNLCSRSLLTFASIWVFLAAAPCIRCEPFGAMGPLLSLLLNCFEEMYFMELRV